MPNWNQLLDEIKSSGSTHDIVRRKYIDELHDLTGRNVIIYYSGWLQKGPLIGDGFQGFSVNDADKTGFMSTIHELDRSLGLDLILHTPGGSIAATESLVDYLRSMFGSDIRAIVPQLALSGGTMMALASNEIIMGKHSSLGPIDPQIGGLPAHGIVEEFKRAKKDIKIQQTNVHAWRPILSKYSPALIGEAEKAIDWAEEIVEDWLKSGMFDGDPDADDKAEEAIEELGDHALNKSHDRHISLDRVQNETELNVTALEADDDLQDAVLTVHHACIHTLTQTAAYKIIENQNEIAFIQTIQST